MYGGVFCFVCVVGVGVGGVCGWGVVGGGGGGGSDSSRCMKCLHTEAL